MAPPRNAIRSAGLMPSARRLRRSHVGANRYEHADVAREARKDSADREADRGIPVERQSERNEEHDADDRDRRVLAVHVGVGAFLNRCRDLLHAIGPGRASQDPAGHEEPIYDREHGGAQRQPKRYVRIHPFSSQPSTQHGSRRASGRELKTQRNPVPRTQGSADTVRE